MTTHFTSTDTAYPVTFANHDELYTVKIPKLERTMGIDVSRWQDDNSTPQRMNFTKAYDAGARFVFVKASQACWMDEDMLYNWKSAKDALLLRGAYLYLDWTRSAVEQAHFFCNLLEKDPGELPPVVDFERRKGVPNDAVDRLEIACNIIEERLNKFAIIYTSPYYWREYGSEDEWWNLHDLWIANYEVIKPYVPAPWDKWTFWQWTDKGNGKLFGAESYGLDMNWFNGSFDALIAYAGATLPEPPPEPEPEKCCICQAWGRVKELADNAINKCGCTERSNLNDL